MSDVLCITVRFLDPMPGFHGRADGGEPEWPPSPLRLFQALVDSAASRWRGPRFDDYAKPLLMWMEKLIPPTIIAPAHHVGIPVRIAVPNNDLDVWAGPLSRGSEPKKQPNELKTMKTVRPTHLTGDAVHYLYPVADAAEFAKHKETLVAAARSVTHLGWGVDMVAGNAAEVSGEEAAKLAGERWEPSKDGAGTPLRVAREGTLKALIDKHAAFLVRLSSGGFKPVSPLTTFEVVGYRRETDVASRPWAAFRIASVDPDDANPSFDTPRKCTHVAAWVRCATGKVCEDWPDVASFVHGHDPADSSKQLKGENADRRFMYLPLPSIERRGERGEHVGAIRRVLVAAPPGHHDRIEWLRQRLPGQELVWGADVKGVLTQLSASDWVRRQYTHESRVWSTVTPVVWPGHDDGDAGKAERVLRKAFMDAGLSEELVDGIVELDWRAVGFRAGLALASQYEKPDKLTGRQYHVRVRFSHRIRGPLAVGAGRYRGLGLFATEVD